MRINLKKDNHYTAVFRRTEEGTWLFDPRLRQLIFTGDKGVDKMKVIGLTSTTLTIDLGTGKMLIFERVINEMN